MPSNVRRTPISEILKWGKKNNNKKKERSSAS
jgi:hypothetical protein